MIDRASSWLGLRRLSIRWGIAGALLASLSFAPAAFAKPVTYRLHTPGVV